MHIEPEQFYDFDFVCRYWGGEQSPVNKATVYRWIANHQHPRPVKMGALSRFYGSDLIAERDRRLAASREVA